MAAVDSWSEHLSDVLDLADLFRPAWAELSESIPAWHPRNEGDDDAEGNDGEAEEGKDESNGSEEGHPDSRWDDPPDEDGDDPGDGEGKFGDDPERTKREARKHERRAKKAEQRARDLEAKLKEIEGQNQSEQEKAIEKARDEARAEAKAEYEKSVRSTRLEGSVLRLAAKGVTVGDGDDAKRLRFDDPDDALVFIEREISRGDLDEDDIFDEDGKVNQDAVTAALVDLLARKPRLAAGSADEKDERRKPAGGADQGKGKGAAKALADLSVEEHVKRLAEKG